MRKVEEGFIIGRSIFNREGGKEGVGRQNHHHDEAERGFFHNASEWDRAALRPQNPLSKVWYRGGNRMKLMAVVTERGYRDPRWCTAKQLFEKGYRIKTGEHGIICEKWIFEKEKKTKDQHGNIV